MENDRKNTFLNPTFYLSLKSIYLGAQTTIGLQDTSSHSDDVKQFRIKILNFYFGGIVQIFKRFFSTDDVFKYLQILDPEIVKIRVACTISW